MQVFALDIVMHAEWIERQNANPVVQRVRREFSEGLWDDEAGSTGSGELEDLSAVKWQSPSDLGDETGVMNDIEMFNQAMAANVHQVVGEDGGGEWL